ncbi:HAD hydrolase-like protein [Candidatus Woesearchaeota archaeon]|nr:HAD hydrolase-like protein [Candidatus Woesearchaeota archaeon]
MHNAAILDFSRTLYDPDNGCLIEGAKELLNALQHKKYQMILVSRTKDLQHKHLEHLGIRHFFSEIIITTTKDESMFSAIANDANINPAQVLVIGDKAQSEIIAGKKAGMKTIWFRSGKYAHEIPLEGMGPDVMVDKLIDIIKYI